ncbi:kynureninase [Testicularia cyperi]|uniref:Kynureninase n=1 Tax=Testicularia cyperi TaxID=1882483 RepID=A0A317XI19_9BASI|nr:kynureninase [Testicularia cyperi]
MTTGTTTAIAEKDLQSTLLRTSVICASSIQSLREPAQPTILPSASSSSPASSSLPAPRADELAQQITSDLSQLLTLVQKHTTSLGIALKPSSKSSSTTASSNGAEPASQDDDTFSPLSGLDTKSLEAAQAQIVSLGSDIIPKLVFLSKKAWKDREVFQKRPDNSAQDPAKVEERRKLEQMAKEMGAQIMTADQLALPASERDDLVKVLECSLGNSYAREIRSAVEDVIGGIADLFHSLLDNRARKALQKARSARDEADGIAVPFSKKVDASPIASGSVAEARSRVLAANNLVWETCAKYIGERNADGSPKTVTSVAPNGVRTKVHITGLSRNNLEASKRSWNNRVELMRDGLEELRAGTEADASSAAVHAEDDDDDDDDEFSFPAATPLSPEQKDRLRKMSNLVKIGNMAHETILKCIVKAGSAADAALDLDEIEELGKQLEEAQDELVAACLYGESDAGLDVKMFDNDADEIEDAHDENDDADLTDEQAIEKAILRTLENYVQAAVNLSAYATDRDDLVEDVNIACATDEEGDFATVFDAKFARLSKVLGAASSDIVLRRSGSSSSPSTSSAAGRQPKTVSAVPPQSNDAFKTEVFVQELQNLAQQLGDKVAITDRLIAEQLDLADPLSSMRDGYILPTFKDVCSADHKADSPETAPDAPSLYMCGNSLGPLSKLTKHYLEQEIEAWGRKAVLGHFEHPYGKPWTQMEKRVGELSANIVGAKEKEVVVMGTLTGNLHTMLATFYRPATKPFGVQFHGDVEAAKKAGKKVKHKIIFEQKAFPSDQYALASVIELNGYDPATSLVPLKPKGSSKTLETADILATIEEMGKEGETALMLLGGIQYFTGQLFELEKLAAKAHEYGILFGVDLAHAFANVPLALHDWDIDFAVWCTYKYGSSGPGGIAGVFVHEKWHGKEAAAGGVKAQLTRPAGWWGHDRVTRFTMPDAFVPSEGAEGWQVSNPSMLDMAALKGSLETLHKATQLVDKLPTAEEGKVGKGTVMPLLRSKSLRLTAYLETLLLTPGFFPDGFDINIVTPRDPLQRGSQLCVRIPEPEKKQAPKPAAQQTDKKQHDGKEVPPPIDGTRLIARAHRRAEKQRGLVADIRHPDMLRLAPLAQFSTFTDVWRTADVLRKSILDEVEAQKTA